MSVSETTYRGGGKLIAISASFNINELLGRVQSWNVSVDSLVATLPDARRQFKSGGPILIIINTGIFSITVKDRSAVTIGVVGAGQIATVTLSNNTTETGVWHINVNTQAPIGTTTTTTTTTAAPTTTTAAPPPPITTTTVAPTTTTAAPTTTTTAAPTTTQGGQSQSHGPTTTPDLSATNTSGVSFTQSQGQSEYRVLRPVDRTNSYHVVGGGWLTEEGL